MDEKEVEQISIAISLLKGLSAEVVEEILDEYLTLFGKTHIVGSGGVSFARQAIASALGDEQAESMLSRIEQTVSGSAFQMLDRVENTQLASFLQNEHPQTAALILSHVTARKASEIVGLLKEEQQEEVVYRLATMGKTSPVLVKEIESVIRDQVGSVMGAELSTSGGVELVADILNSSSRATERTIMDALTERDPVLAGSVKALMFMFDDLIKVDGRDLQKLLSEIDQRDLVLSLKGCDEELKEKLMANVSERAAGVISEELALLGPVKVSEIEEAQKRIIEEAQNLEEREEISLGRESAEEMVI